MPKVSFDKDWNTNFPYENWDLQRYCPRFTVITKLKKILSHIDSQPYYAFIIEQALEAGQLNLIETIQIKSVFADAQGNPCIELVFVDKWYRDFTRSFSLDAHQMIERPSGSKSPQTLQKEMRESQESTFTRGTLSPGRIFSPPPANKILGLSDEELSELPDLPDFVDHSQVDGLPKPR